jgi:hypothetical protein
MEKVQQRSLQYPDIHHLGGKESLKPKGTRLNTYTVKVQIIETIVGTSEMDALINYQSWLNEHVSQWKILDGPEYKGEAW